MLASLMNFSEICLELTQRPKTLLTVVRYFFFSSAKYSNLAAYTCAFWGLYLYLTINNIFSNMTLEWLLPLLWFFHFECDRLTIDCKASGWSFEMILWEMILCWLLHKTAKFQFSTFHTSGDIEIKRGQKIYAAPCIIHQSTPNDLLYTNQ
jgi:hypothetical protein